jgi:hypothetical protein
VQDAAAAPQQTQAQRYKGVHKADGKYKVVVADLQGKIHHGGRLYPLHEAVVAAQARDNLARSLGRKDMNFPHKGETKAAFSWKNASRAGSPNMLVSANDGSIGGTAAAKQGATPPQQYVQRYCDVRRRNNKVVVVVRDPSSGKNKYGGTFSWHEQDAAARRRDDLARELGRTDMNFPREGEEQAKFNWAISEKAAAKCQGRSSSVSAPPVSPPPAAAAPAARAQPAPLPQAVQPAFAASTQPEATRAAMQSADMLLAQPQAESAGTALLARAQASSGATEQTLRMLQDDACSMLLLAALAALSDEPRAVTPRPAVGLLAMGTPPAAAAAAEERDEAGAGAAAKPSFSLLSQPAQRALLLRLAASVLVLLVLSSRGELLLTLRSFVERAAAGL